MDHEIALFKALSDPTRRQILQELKDGELPAGDIVGRFEISGPSISRHLMILKMAKLIEERKVGNSILYKLSATNLTNSLNDFVSKVCPTQRKYTQKRRT